MTEFEELKQQVALLKEQIRVADVAYQYLFEEHKKTQAELDDIKDRILQSPVAVFHNIVLGKINFPREWALKLAGASDYDELRKAHQTPKV